MGKSKAQLLQNRVPAKNRQYDPDKMAEELLEWVKDEESINFTQFCADRGYLPGLIWRLEKESEEFSYAYQIAKMKLAERRERFLNAEMLNYGAYQRYQSDYDPFLNKHENVEKDKDSARKKEVVKEERLTLAALLKLASDGEISQKD